MNRLAIIGSGAGILTVGSFALLGSVHTSSAVQPVQNAPEVIQLDGVQAENTESKLEAPAAKATTVTDQPVNDSPSIQAKTEVKTITPAPKAKPEPKKVIAPITPSCNPNYSGCLKINAGDYDCAGGTGNGPNYTGPVQVLGYDEYGLDRDNDGWSCEK